MKTETPRSKELRLEHVGPDWLTIRGLKQLFALILLFNLTGCFGQTVIKPYPEAWPPAATVPAGQCPDVSGEYVNSGAVNAGAGEWNRWSCRSKYPSKAGWNCDSSLAGNLAKMKAVDMSDLSSARNVYLVKLQQPDPDTLEVYLPPKGSPPKIFKRTQGDFECDSSSLKFSMTGNAFSTEDSSTARNIVITTGELALYAAVAVASTERVFRPLQDGSLSMEATESGWLTALVIFNAHSKRNAFVRWERYVPPPPVSIPTYVSPSSP